MYVIEICSLAYHTVICMVEKHNIEGILPKGPYPPWNGPFWQDTLHIEAMQKYQQKCCHFGDNIFRCIFLNKNVWISLKISLKFVPKFQINNIPVLVQIMAWRWPVDKPLSEPIMVSLLMHICHLAPMSYQLQTLWKSNKVLVSIAAADALVLGHQAINIHIIALFST